MKRAKKGTIGNNIIVFKVPKDMYEKLKEFANERYFGNQSMVIRIALKEYFERELTKQLLKAPAPSPQRPTPREPSSIGGERA